MRVSVFGFGYVGTVSAGCLANDAHEVVGVDPIQTKLDLINQATLRLTSRRSADYSGKRQVGPTSAVVDPEEAIQGTDLSFVCVGTPSQPEWQPRSPIHSANL